MESDDGESYGEEMIADDSDVEFDYIKSQDPEMIRPAVQSLDDKERQVIEPLFLSSKPITEQEAANKIGISQ